MGVYEMGPFGSHPPVSEQKHFLDIKDAPSATCWSVLKGEPGRVPWALWGDAACPTAAPVPVTTVPPCSAGKSPVLCYWCFPPRCQTVLVSICGLQDFAVFPPCDSSVHLRRR